MNHNPISHCATCNRFVDEPCPWPDCELAGEPEHSWTRQYNKPRRSLAWFALFFSGIMAWYVIFEVIF